MKSLRTRLVAGLLALAAIGLVALAGITYAEQRSFLLDRVDQQLREAPMALAHALADQGVGQSPGPRPRRLRRRPGRADPGRTGRRESCRPAPTAPATPPTARGSARSRSGYGDETATAQPKLPKTLEPNTTFTVGASGGDDVEFRVRVSPDPDGSGGLLVAAIPLTEVNQTLERLLLVEGLVIAGVLLLLGIGAWILVRVGLLPLDRMAHTAGTIAGGDLSQRVDETDPRSEVGRLGLAFNGMLDRLEVAFEQRRASEERLRRFLADASHELRTPLSSIRGYAELFRIGAAREPADTEKAMRRIEEEASRMGVLVEDLLALARLDEVREAEHGPVDLAQLARDAADDARAAAPARTISLDVQAGGGALVEGNAHQLRQVLANLLRNALVHTPEGTPIELTVERAGGAAATVRVSVRDHGRGLPPDVRPEELFERFWRAEGGRTRGQAGAGLGLAIVAGIVAAHDGTVQARDAAGGGAEFVVSLPSR